MVFLVKQPSELPRVLSASHCPPNNVLHDISEFPLYYDPLYYPTCFSSIFSSPIKVCEWLLNGLQVHFDFCSSCIVLQAGLEPFVDDARYCASIFEIRFRCLRIHIPISYIESSSFSFCCLHALLVEKSNKFHTTFCNNDNGDFKVFVDLVVSNVPLWIFRENEDCSNRLMSLSMSQLRPVVRSLEISNCRSKFELVKAIVDDFSCKRHEFCNSLTECQNTYR